MDDKERVPKQEVGKASRFLGFLLTLSASVGTFGFFAIQGVLLARILGPSGRGVFAACVVFPQALLWVGLLGASELFAGFAAEGKSPSPLRRSAVLYGLTAGIISTICCIILDVFTIPAEIMSALPLAILCACTMPFQQIRLSVLAVDHGNRNLARYNKSRLIAAAAFPTLLLVVFLTGAFEKQPNWPWDSPAAGSRAVTTLAETSHGPKGDEETAAGSIDTKGPIAEEGYSDSDIALACFIFVVAHCSCLLLANWGMTDSWFGERSIPVVDALKKAKGLIGAWFSTELLERIDLVLIMILFADEELMGFYATAVPIAALMIIVPNSAGIYAFNKGARTDELLSVSEAWRFIGVGLLAQATCGFALAAALPLLVPLVYGEAFAPAVVFAWILIPAGAFRGLLQAAESYLRARKKPTLGLKARLVAIPVLLGCSFGLSPSLGAYAVPVGLTIAQVVCFVIVAMGVVKDSERIPANQLQPLSTP